MELLPAIRPIPQLNPAANPTAHPSRIAVPGTASVLVHTAVAGGLGHDEAMHEVGDGFSTGDAGDGGKDDGHVEFDAAEDVGADDGGGDVCGVDF